MATFPVYESRLRMIINAIGSMSDTQLTLEWRRILDQHSSEDLALAISAITSPAAKEMLNGHEPPTLEHIESLVAVADSHKPGVYLGLTQPTSEDSHDQKAYAYTGSATRVGRGFEGRVPSHLDPAYRAKYLEKTPNYYHYLLLEDGTRAETFYVLADTE
jgi:hypothetical protein